jgi:hypothetical protein
LLWRQQVLYAPLWQRPWSPQASLDGSQTIDENRMSSLSLDAEQDRYRLAKLE